jgi:hypothetical protein
VVKAAPWVVGAAIVILGAAALKKTEVWMECVCVFYGNGAEIGHSELGLE